MPWLDCCRQAIDVRRDWLQQFLTRKTAPKGTAGFVAAMIAAHPDLLPDIDGNHLASEWLGQTADSYNAARVWPT